MLPQAPYTFYRCRAYRQGQALASSSSYPTHTMGLGPIGLAYCSSVTSHSVSGARGAWTGSLKHIGVIPAVDY